MAELCDVCKKPLEWPTDGDPTDDFQTSICRHMVRSAPTASPKASEEAPAPDPGVEEIRKRLQKHSGSEWVDDLLEWLDGKEQR